jgi:ATP-binding cassette subfamily C (CFTR/MRP) protein 1
MSLDAQRLMDLVPYLHMVWSSFFQIGVSLGLLWRVVGVSTLGGLAGAFALAHAAPRRRHRDV